MFNNQFIFSKIKFLIFLKKIIFLILIGHMTGMMQSFQWGDSSLESWLGDSKKIGPEMQEKTLGFSWVLG